MGHQVSFLPVGSHAAPLIVLRLIARLLRPAVAVLLTGYVLYRANPSAVLEAGANTGLRWIVFAVALVVVDRALMAYRWIVLLCPVDPAARPPLGALLRLFFISTFAGTFLPASIGGDIVRAYGLAKLQVEPGQAMASVLMDRLLGVVSILVVGAAGVLLASTGDLASTRAITLSLAAGASLSLAAASVIFSERAASLAQATALRMPVPAVRRLGGDLARATRAYATHHGALANVMAGSIAVQGLRILQAWCLGMALGISAPLSLYFGLIPLILLVMLLPVSINGLGTSQMGFVWFFGRAGVPEPQAFALSVLFLGLGVLGNLPGGLLYALGPAPKPARP